uniref:Uncharacterized protein n=1 Tax=Clastoptera arizonana TaxID=38151 RepID=A0A1B6E4T9_9HEMI
MVIKLLISTLVFTVGHCDKASPTDYFNPEERKFLVELIAQADRISYEVSNSVKFDSPDYAEQFAHLEKMLTADLRWLRFIKAKSKALSKPFTFEEDVPMRLQFIDERLQKLMASENDPIMVRFDQILYIVYRTTHLRDSFASFCDVSDMASERADVFGFLVAMRYHLDEMKNNFGGKSRDIEEYVTIPPIERPMM